MLVVLAAPRVAAAPAPAALAPRGRLAARRVHDDPHRGARRHVAFDRLGAERGVRGAGARRRAHHDVRRDAGRRVRRRRGRGALHVARLVGRERRAGRKQRLERAERRDAGAAHVEHREARQRGRRVRARRRRRKHRVAELVARHIELDELGERRDELQRQRALQRVVAHVEAAQRARQRKHVDLAAAGTQQRAVAQLVVARVERAQARQHVADLGRLLRRP